MSGDDRPNREQRREARQAKLAARMKRRAERGQETAAKARSPVGPAKPLKGERGAKAEGGRTGRAKAREKKPPEHGMLPYVETMRIRLGNAERSGYPDRLHASCRGGALFPAFLPKFKLGLGPGDKVFTIGTGFARDIEPVLEARGVTVPTTAITTPPSDLGRTENPLNEYTPASIAQRLNAAFNETRTPKGTVMEVGQLFSDQYLPGHFNDTMENLEARRAEIAAIYARLRDCDAAIITLASAETWYDGQTKRFFNRPPPTNTVRSRVAYIYFGIQDVGEVVSMLNKPVAELGAAGIKVVLTVSPAAQRTTYAAMDAVTANELSKAVLRVAAHRLTQKFEHVDYFPAYEIARSAGLSAYLDDNVQLREEFTALLLQAFIGAYGGTP